MAMLQVLMSNLHKITVHIAPSVSLLTKIDDLGMESTLRASLSLQSVFLIWLLPRLPATIIGPEGDHVHATQVLSFLFLMRKFVYQFIGPERLHVG